MRKCRRDQMEFCDVLIVGAGAAGMACALTLTGLGKRVILAERKEHTGGVLEQCAHSGFGSRYFGREMTGPEYARCFEEPLLKLSKDPSSGLKIMTDTTVLRINEDRSALLSGPQGIITAGFRKLILAAGCRERSIYSQLVAGARPAGVMTCGMAQRLMNVWNLQIDDPVVILGTGDIGQIVARELIRRGKQVLCMIEQRCAPGGRRRNRQECIEAFHIPVILNSTIVRIYGNERIQGVLVRNLKSGQERRIDCRMLLTAIGLIPETDLLEPFGKALPEWISLAGNCRAVHDVVDSVTIEAQKTAAGLFPEEGCGRSSCGPVRENG